MNNFETETEVLQRGNTRISVATKPEKTWDVTINNYSETDVLFLDNLEVSKIIVSKEIGEQGTPHLQGRITFKRTYRLAALKKLHPKAHWEVTSLAGRADFNYMMKIDSEVVIKKLPIPKQGKRNDLDDLYHEIHNGLKFKEFVHLYPSIYIRYRNGIEAIYSLIEKKRDFKPIVTWIYGTSGAGKTKYVYDRHNMNDIWPAPDDLTFFNKYQNEEVALFDDFRGKCNFNEFLKIIDRYPYTCNIKGGYKEFNSKYIYITSIRPPEKTWSFLGEEEPLYQLTRRIDHIIEMK